MLPQPLHRMESASGSGTSAAEDSGSRPKVVVFDLDGCVWYPEMYMLWGGGAPFKAQSNGDLKDTAGQKCYLMGALSWMIGGHFSDSDLCCGTRPYNDACCSSAWAGAVREIMASLKTDSAWGQPQLPLPPLGTLSTSWCVAIAGQTASGLSRMPWCSGYAGCSRVEL